MMFCRQARAAIVDSLRSQASDATRLDLEAHLNECEACCAERARWAIFGALIEYEPPALRGAARQRIVERLVATPPPTAKPVAVTARRGLVFAGAFSLAATAALVLLLRPPTPPPAAASLVAQPRRGGSTKLPLCAELPGEAAIPGATLSYRRGTSLVAAPGRALQLTAGEVEIEARTVDGQPLRVSTRHFVVEILSARVVIAPTVVRAVSGEVRVFDLEAHELARLAAGASFALPGTPSAVVETACGPSETAPAAPAIPPPPAASPPVAAPPPATGPGTIPAARSIEQARRALADQDLTGMRRLLQRALAAHPSQRERATIDLLTADALLREHHPERAAQAYHAVARAFADLPEGEAAAFARAQLLTELRRMAEAESALRDYLARYPRGGFVREARERLDELPPSTR